MKPNDVPCVIQPQYVWLYDGTLYYYVFCVNEKYARRHLNRLFPDKEFETKKPTGKFGTFTVTSYNAINELLENEV